MNPLRERPGPRPRTWLALGAMVLISHAALVFDWGALWTLTQSPERTSTNSAASTSEYLHSAVAPAPQPAVVQVAQVRWIVPEATPTVPARPVVATSKATHRPPQKAPQAMHPASQPLPEPLLSTQTEPERPTPPTVLAERATPDTDAAAQKDASASTLPTAPAMETPALATRATASTEAASPNTGLQPASTLPTLLPGNLWLRYDVTGQIKGLNYRAGGEIRWHTSERRYQADFKISAFLLGSRSQQSTGRLTDTGLVPERFADKKNRSERAAHFEPEQGRIRFSNNAPDAPWLAGTQDQLSVFFQLAAWLNARPDSLREGQRLSLPVAGTSGADQWQLLVEASVPLDLPAGHWDTLRVSVLQQKNFDQRIELWLAPKLDHLPVRIRLTQINGDVADLQLSALP